MLGVTHYKTTSISPPGNRVRNSRRLRIELGPRVHCVVAGAFLVDGTSWCSVVSIKPCFPREKQLCLRTQLLLNRGNWTDTNDVTLFVRLSVCTSVTTVGGLFTDKITTDRYAIYARYYKQFLQIKVEQCRAYILCAVLGEMTYYGKLALIMHYRHKIIK